MCEASNWRKIHSYICITCYLLCVFFDVHLHGVKCAPKSSFPTKYDAVAKPNGTHEYVILRKARFTNTFHVCQNITALNDTKLFKNHLDMIIKQLTPTAGDVNASKKGDIGVRLFNKFLKKIDLGEVHSHEGNHEEEEEEKLEETEARKKKSECMSAQEIYKKIGLPQRCSMRSEQFQEICPSLLYQLSQKSCEEEEKKSPATATAAIWGCSTAAVIVISLVGLFAVAVIPFMKKGFYDILVQFLIAVGVGTLAGDAILHLIPHALVSHDHSSGSHGSDKEMQMTVWKSSMALIGAHVFFVTERLTTMLQSYRVRRRLRRKKQTDIARNPGDNLDPVLEPMNTALCATANRNGHGRSSEVPLVSTPGSAAPTEVTSIGGSNYDFGMKPANPSHCHGNTMRMTNSDCNVVAEEADRLMHQTTVHHCHSHDFSSIKAIAWTVIMGDGLHNFCDGVAIGAAFANDLRGGLSTSIAVIWHELPHEIGDFAVLLQAGMSVKMALFYNILSSIFCFAGMVIGITVGGMHSVTPWVFMLSAGMFLYIAFVDMLPNLTCDQVDEKGQPTTDSTKAHRKLVFFVQNAGILLGYAVMFLIALYEDKILS